MKYFDNVVKCFGGSLILYSTTLASMLIFGSQVDAAFMLGLMIYSVSSYFYAGDHNGKLELYAKHQAELSRRIMCKEESEMAALVGKPGQHEADSTEETVDLEDAPPAPSKKK